MLACRLQAVIPEVIDGIYEIYTIMASGVMGAL